MAISSCFSRRWATSPRPEATATSRRIGQVHTISIFSARRRRGCSSTPRRLSNSSHLHITYPPRDSLSSFRSSTALPTGIDLLYTQILNQAFHDADSDEQELYSRFKLVVGAVLLVFYPLSRKRLSELLINCGTPSHISNTLRSLHSLLLIPTSEVDPIRTFRKSFPDSLTDPGRCKDERFFVDPRVHHTDILFPCLDLMKKSLRKNICDLEGCPVLSEIEDLPVRRKTYIGSGLEYACRFWTRHLVKIPENGPHVKATLGLELSCAGKTLLRSD